MAAYNEMFEGLMEMETSLDAMVKRMEQLHDKHEASALAGLAHRVEKRATLLALGLEVQSERMIL